MSKRSVDQQRSLTHHDLSLNKAGVSAGGGGVVLPSVYRSFTGVDHPDCGVAWADGGARLYWSQKGSGHTIYTAQAATPYDVTTLGAVTSGQITGFPDDDAKQFVFNTDGSKVLVCDDAYFYEFTLGTAWDVFNNTTSEGGAEGYGYILGIDPTGTHMFSVHGGAGNQLSRHTLSTSFHLSTKPGAVTESLLSPPGPALDFDDHWPIRFTHDGLMLIPIDQDGLAVYQFAAFPSLASLTYIGTMWVPSTGITYGYTDGPGGVGAILADGSQFWLGV